MAYSLPPSHLGLAHLPCRQGDCTISSTFAVAVPLSASGCAGTAFLLIQRASRGPSRNHPHVYCKRPSSFHLLNTICLFSPVCFKGNLSLREICSFFSRGIIQMEASIPGSRSLVPAHRKCLASTSDCSREVSGHYDP